MDDQDDVALVERCIRGDTEAFAPLVARYQKVLFNVAYRMVGDYEDARDISQDAFVKAYEKLDLFDPSRRFFSWIYRIMINECLNHLRRRKPLEPLDPRLASPGSLQDDLQARETSRRLRAALDELATDDREVLILRHFVGLSYAEVGALLEISEKTVKSRLYTARQRLGGLLGARSPAR